jgi:CheY-like chemotaxis protein
MSLEGTLSYLDIAHLLQVVGRGQKSGVLTISWEGSEAKLFFEEGRLVRAESNKVHENLGTLLVQVELLGSEELEEALSIQRSDGGARRFGAILCDEFGVRHEEIVRLLRRQFEGIVFDVFSWPTGRFVFHFEHPNDPPDRFHLDAVDFILEVGIQAGLLAEEGLDRETADPERPHLIFLEDDPDLLARYRDHWRRKAHRVTCFSRAEDVLSYLASSDPEAPPPVLIVSLFCPRCGGAGLLGGLEVLEALRTQYPAVGAIVVGETDDAKARDAVLAAGARVFVRKPRGAELRGIQGGVHFDVFMLSLERAIEGPAAPVESATPGEGAGTRRADDL